MRTSEYAAVSFKLTTTQTKLSSPSTPLRTPIEKASKGGLSASKYAEDDVKDTKETTTEAEGEQPQHDNSSAAIATVRRFS